MAEIRKIRIMISSRSMSKVFGGTPLREVRERLRTFLHGIRWQGIAVPGADPVGGPVGRDQALFDVWIHEDDVGRSADTSTLEMSLREINRADIILALYNGEAGSAHGEAELGICHAELKEALERRSELVMIIDLLPLTTGRTARDRNFRQYLEQLEVPRMQAADEASLQRVVAEALQECVSRLVKRGGNVGSRKRDRGPALDWNRLDLSQRRERMREALVESLAGEELDSPPTNGYGLHQLPLPGGQALAARIDAIPAALTVAAARERVGQPFLRDHLHASALRDEELPGVVHLIACHRGVTESQASRMLGIPDAMSVASDFGVYSADHVQKIQIVFLAQCGDDTAVALAVRRFREWLVQSGEESRVIERARARRRILQAIAQEL